MQLRFKNTQLIITHDTEEASYGWASLPYRDFIEYPDHGVKARLYKGGAEGAQDAYTRALAMLENFKKSGDATWRAVIEKNNRSFPSNDKNFGTHLPLLLTAVTVTTGDVIELGTGWYSTPNLHDLLANTSRNLFSADTDSLWLSKFERFRSPQHILRYVHVYNDRIGCYDDSKFGLDNESLAKYLV